MARALALVSVLAGVPAFAGAADEGFGGTPVGASASQPGEKGAAEGLDVDPPLESGAEPRQRPDYGGYGRAVPERNDGWLWLPRVLVFPAYLVSEYVIRAPVGAALRFAERHHLVVRYYDLLTFGPEKEIGIFPTARFDLGLRARAGLSFFWKNVVPQSTLRFRAVTGGSGSWEGRGSLLSSDLTDGLDLQLFARGDERPDRAFFGLGPRSGSDAARYGETLVDVGWTLSFELSPRAKLEALSSLRRAWFDPDRRAFGDGSLAEAIDSNSLSPPPALLDGESALSTGLRFSFDGRPPARVMPQGSDPHQFDHVAATGAGFRLHAVHYGGLSSTRAAETDRRRSPHWLNYGAEAVGALDLTGTRRCLELWVFTRFVDGLPEDNPVPFVEQVSLGGSQPMPGFRQQQLLGESATVATVSYRWPVWVALEGALHYAVGNVFGRHLAGFEPGALRSSFGVGLNSGGSSTDSFVALLAFGTRPFDEGGEVESVRFVLGSSAGF